MTTCSETCAICLDDINDKDEIYTLSCDHTYHHSCFMSYVFQKGHSFVTCPLCRSMNTRKPVKPELSDKGALSAWFIPANRCISITKKGRKCKNRPIFMNGGCCKIHGSYILPESMYPIYRDYVNYVLESTNHWATKIYMLDIARKISCISENKITNISDIHHYFLEFFHRCRHDKISPSEQGDPRTMYSHCNIPFPSREWVILSLYEGRRLL